MTVMAPGWDLVHMRPGTAMPFMTDRISTQLVLVLVGKHMALVRDPMLVRTAALRGRAASIKVTLALLAPLPDTHPRLKIRAAPQTRSWVNSSKPPDCW